MRLGEAVVLIPYPSLLHLSRQHDDGTALSLMNHLPSTGLFQGSLCYDESLLLAVVAGKGGMDVVLPLVLQWNSPLVNCTEE